MVIIYCSASILKDVCTPYENWPNVAGMGRGGGVESTESNNCNITVL